MTINFRDLKISQLPFLKQKDAIAVDIGTSSIKVVYLKREPKNKFSLVKWGVIPGFESVASVSPEERIGMISTRLAEFLANEKISIRNVVTSVCGNQIIVRYVRFPKLSREELNKTIQFEAEPYIPFDIREVDLSFHIIGDIVENGQKKLDAILVAAKKEVIQSRLDILKSINLRPVVVDLDAFAIENAYELSTDPSILETVLLINIGSSITNMAIIENHVSRVVRDILISGNTFSKAIQKNLACDIQTAEDFKCRHKILVTVEEKEQTLAENQKEAIQVSTALTTVAKELVSEIQRSIDFFISQNSERGINKIVLTGGSANLKNLDVYLSQELKTPVEIFNPVKNLIGGEIVPENLSLQLSVAVGLALRYEGDIPRK